MAEIILDAERELEHQLRKVLDLAAKGGHGLSRVIFHPQAGDNGETLPHGGVVEVPDELAEAYAKHVQLEAARTAKRSAKPAASTDSDKTQE